MRMHDVFPSTYLKADDIPVGRVVSARIDRVQIEELGQGQDKEKKPVMYFVGKEKGLVMNKTNWQTVADVYGDESEDWHNQAIGIARDKTMFAGKSVECLRLRVVTNGSGGQAAPVSAAPVHSMAARGQEIRNRAPVEPPFEPEDQQFKDDDIPF